MASHNLPNKYDNEAFDLVDHQTRLNIFEGDQQSDSLFDCINFYPIRALSPLPQRSLELKGSQDNLAVSLEQGGQIVLSQEEEHPKKDQENGSIKQNFCKFLGKNVRRIAKTQLDNGLSPYEAQYLRFLLEDLKNTRRSLRQFLITYPRPDLLKRFEQFLSEGIKYSQAKIQDVLNDGTEYLRRLICSKQTQMKADVKTQQKREEFSLFIKRTIQDLKENRMRGKDEKSSTKKPAESAEGNPILRQRKRSTLKTITSPLILSESPKLVDLSCFSAQPSSLSPQS